MWDDGFVNAWSLSLTLMPNSHTSVLLQVLFSGWVAQKASQIHPGTTSLWSLVLQLLCISGHHTSVKLSCDISLRLNSSSNVFFTHLLLLWNKGPRDPVFQILSSLTYFLSYPIRILGHINLMMIVCIHICLGLSNLGLYHLHLELWQKVKQPWDVSTFASKNFQLHCDSLTTHSFLCPYPHFLHFLPICI